MATPAAHRGRAGEADRRAADFFYVIAIRADGSIDWLFTESVNQPSWRQTTIDVSRYRGQTIRFQFGTYNNGSGGISRTFVDDVSLQLCPPAGALVLPAGWVRRVIGRPESSTLYADVAGVLYRSDDAGASWRVAGSIFPEHADPQRRPEHALSQATATPATRAAIPCPCGAPPMAARAGKATADRPRSQAAGCASEPALALRGRLPGP